VQEQICDFDKNEVSEIQWVSKSKRRAMIANSEIRCGVLLIGMLRFLL
jgi:isopentenyldiphosphate isomerase